MSPPSSGGATVMVLQPELTINCNSQAQILRISVSIKSLWVNIHWYEPQ